MIEVYNTINHTKNYDEENWSKICDTINKYENIFIKISSSICENHRGCLYAILSSDLKLYHPYVYLKSQYVLNACIIIDNLLKNCKAGVTNEETIVINTAFDDVCFIYIKLYDEKYISLYKNKQKCFENNSVSTSTTEKCYKYSTNNCLLNCRNVYKNIIVFDTIHENCLNINFKKERIQNGADRFYKIDSCLKTNENKYGCQVYESKRQPEGLLFENGMINTFDRSTHHKYFYEYYNLERRFFIKFSNKKHEKGVIYYNNIEKVKYLDKNTTNLCKSDIKTTVFEILPDDIIKNEPDFLQTKKKSLDSAEFLDDSKCINRYSNDKLCLGDPGVTKIIKNGKDMRKIEKKVGNDNKHHQKRRSVDKQHQEFNEVETMVDNISVDFRNDFKARYKSHKKNRSGKSAGISATRVVIVFAILIHHTDAIEGILGRLLREALGWGACPGLPRRPCTLSLSCWARGGITVPTETCGPSWLLTCCGPTPEGGLLNQLDEGYREDFTVNSPPQIALFKTDPLDSSGNIWRRTPQIASNVFRRRIDDDYDDESDCGVAGGSDRVLQKRIIGGRAAQLAEFPWQAHIRIGDYQCGGVLVSRWFVATAAHCVQRAHSRDIAVWLGALDTRAQAPPAEKHRVVQKIIHPLFRYRVTQPDRYDLALLMLSRPAILGFNVLPVCLPSSTWASPDRRYRLSQEDNSNYWSPDDSLAGRKALVAGWGSTGNGGAPRGTHRLRSAVVPILSTEECIVWHKSKQISVEIHSEMICAGHSDGHQDACLGDSGGPLVVPKDGRYYLVGITSAGFGCGVDHQPGIYHNVLVTSHWIRHMIRR